MRYINPFNLLDINPDFLFANDSSAIRRAKKTLLAEMELSGTYTVNYNGIEITKSDCLRVIDELDDKDKWEFHYFIYHNVDLNRFLSSSDLTFFKSFKIESIYKLPAFIDFISPYFTDQYEKLLSRNFKDENLANVKLLLSIKPIVNETYFEKCFKSTYSVIKETENEIIQITTDINNKRSHYIENNFIGLPELIGAKVNVELLNLLPTYFQSLRNQFAQTIRSLARDINNDPFNKYKPAYEIIEIANNIITDGLVKQTITKGYYTIKKNYEDSRPNLVKTISQPVSTPKTVPVNNKSEESEEDKEIEEVKSEKESKSYAYWIFLFIAFLIGFFYSPSQKIIIGISLIPHLILFLALFKFKDYSYLITLIKNEFLPISGAILGFFYPIIAQLYFSYYALVYLNTIVAALFKNKNNWIYRLSFYYLLLGAVVITFLFNAQIMSTDNFNYPKYLKHFVSEKNYYQNGLKYYAQSDYNNAIIQYDKAIKINPNYAEAYAERGFSEVNLKQFESAIKDFSKAEELGLNTSSLYSNLGYSYYQLKLVEKALQYFEKALAMDFKNAIALRWRGEIKYDNDDNEGAVEDFTEAIKYNPNASTYFARGLAFYYLNDYENAIQDMDKAIELNPSIAQFYYDRGDAKEKLNDFYGACSDWNIAKTKGFNVPPEKIRICTPKTVHLPNTELLGCDVLKPKYNRKLDNKLIIEVGSNTCVAVKLLNYETNKCIRYVFINKNTSFSIRHIPEGKYYIKIAYGDDWTIFEGQPDCKGRFSRNTLFEKGDEILDYYLKYSDNSYQVPSYSLKLDVIITENKMNTFNSEKISENAFYNE